MGACNGANYVSRQPERSRIVNIHYVNDSRYINYLRLLTKGELFGLRFIFDTLPHSLVPFDYQASVSLPFITKPVRYNGRILMDGGISDPVPLRKSIKDGNARNVVILTRPKG